MLLLGPVCFNLDCFHTHIYQGIQYLDCPYCDCHMHSNESIDAMKVYNIKRFNAWINKNIKQPKREKLSIRIDTEIEALMINSIQ